MTKYLITPSLLESFRFYLQPNEYRTPEEQRADFLQTVSKEQGEKTEAMQKGIDFENAVSDFTEYGLECLNEDFKTVEEIGEIVKGGMWQERCFADISVQDCDIFLYGKCDVIKFDTIYDIKFTKNYEIGKYQPSSQHLIYMYCLGLPQFSYLITDGKDFWQEDYSYDSQAIETIKSKISYFFDYLKGDKEVSDMYFDRWKSKESIDNISK